MKTTFLILAAVVICPAALADASVTNDYRVNDYLVATRLENTPFGADVLGAVAQLKETTAWGKITDIIPLSSYYWTTNYPYTLFGLPMVVSNLSVTTCGTTFTNGSYCAILNLPDLETNAIAVSWTAQKAVSVNQMSGFNDMMFSVLGPGMNIAETIYNQLNVIECYTRSNSTTSAHDTQLMEYKRLGDALDFNVLAGAYGGLISQYHSLIINNYGTNGFSAFYDGAPATLKGAAITNAVPSIQGIPLTVLSIGGDGTNAYPATEFSGNIICVMAFNQPLTTNEADCVNSALRWFWPGNTNTIIFGDSQSVGFGTTSRTNDWTYQYSVLPNRTHDFIKNYAISGTGFEQIYNSGIIASNYCMYPWRPGWAGGCNKVAELDVAIEYGFNDILLNGDSLLTLWGRLQSTLAYLPNYVTPEIFNILCAGTNGTYYRGGFTNGESYAFNTMLHANSKRFKRVFDQSSLFSLGEMNTNYGFTDAAGIHMQTNYLPLLRRAYLFDGRPVP